MRRPWSLLWLLPLVLVQHGCLERIAAIALAPEAGAIGAAGSAAQGVGQGLASLTDETTTIRDLDRILADHPDAQNAGELKELREQMAERERKGAGSGNRKARRAPRPQTLEQQARWDRYAADALLLRGRRGLSKPDRMVLAEPLIPRPDPSPSPVAQTDAATWSGYRVEATRVLAPRPAESPLDAYRSQR